MANHIKIILMADFESEGARAAFLERIKGKEKEFSFQAIIPMPETLLINEPCTNELIYAAVQHYGFRLDQYPEKIQKAVRHCFWPFKQENSVTDGDLFRAYEIALNCRVHFPDETEDNKPCDSKKNVLDGNYFARIKADFDAIGEYALHNVRRYGYRNWYEWRYDNWGSKWEPWDVKIERIGSKKIRIDFTSATSTPQKVLIALSKLFPTVLFDVQYASENIGSDCGWTKYLNGEVIEEDAPLGGDDSIDFACNVWGYDSGDYRKRLDED